MSMTAFELFGFLKLDKSNFDHGMADVQSTVGKVGGVIGGALGTAAKVGAAALGAATTAAVAFGKSSMDAAVSFEDAFTGVRKTTEFTKEQYEDLSAWIQDASTRMASSAEDIAATMEIAGQLGIGEKGIGELEAFTETMIKLGDTTNLSSEEAAGALARLLNITGESTDNISQLGSVIVDLGNHFATTEQDIVNMSTRLASAGSIVGLNSTEILAMSTALSSVGINAEAGGSAMSQVLKKISRSVSENGETLQIWASTAGMSVEEFSAVWNEKPAEALNAFLNGMHAFNEAGGDTIGLLDELGIKEIRQSNAVQALALSDDILGRALEQANTAYEEGNALSAEAELRYGTTASRALQASEAFKNLKRAIGEDLIPVYGEFLAFSTEAMKSMQEGYETGGLEGFFSSFGDALSQGLGTVSEKIPEAIELGGKLLSAIGQGIMDNTDTIVSSAVDVGIQFMTGLVDAISGASEGAGKFMEAFSNALEENQDKINTLGEKITTLLMDALTQGLPNLMTWATTMISDLANTVGENSDGITSAAIAIIQAISQGLSDNLPTLITAWYSLFNEFATSISQPENMEALLAAGGAVILAIAQGILTSLPTMYETMFTVWGNIGAMLAGWGAQLINKIVTWYNGLYATIKGWLAQLPNDVAFALGAMVGFFIQIPSKIEEVWNALVESAISFGERLKETAPRIVREFWDKLKQKFDELPEKLKEIGKHLMEGLFSGITEKLGEAGEFFNGIKDSFVSGLTAAFEVKSPSKVMAREVGQYIPSGIAEGIKQGMGALDEAMASIVDDVTSVPVSSVASPGIARSDNSQIISLLQQIRDGGNVQVVLEGDTDRLFRAMQRKATANYRLTGNPGMVMV